MEILPLLLKSSAVLSSFLLVYYMLLYKSSHFNINRAFLLIGLVTTIFISLVDISYPVYVEIQTPKFTEVSTVIDNEVILAPSQAESVVHKPIDWRSILLWIYAIISSLFFIRLLVSFFYCLKLLHFAKKVHWNNITLYINDKVKNPMVIGNKILVKDTSYLHGEKEQILIHEQIHKEQNHWLDVLMSELLLIMIWFNPLVFIYRKTVLNNLEFIADRGVLDTGLQLNKYIQSILCETMGAETLVLANHFRSSQNKQRLKMMKNVKQSKWGKYKLLLVLPLICGLCWAFSEPEYISTEKPINRISTVGNLNEKAKTFTIKGKVVKRETEIMSVKNHTTGIYTDEVVVGPLPGTQIIIIGTTTGTIVNKYGDFELECMDGDILSFEYIGYKTQKIRVSEGEDIRVAMEKSAFELDPSPYREIYKGKTLPSQTPNSVRKKSSNISKDSRGGPVFFTVMDYPQYKGGENEFFANLYTSITLLKKEKSGLSGDVKVQFTINEKGEMKNIKALNRQDDEEAIYAVKIVSELNEWKAGKQRGKPVPATIVVPVEF